MSRNARRWRMAGLLILCLVGLTSGRASASVKPGETSTETGCSWIISPPGFGGPGGIGGTGCIVPVADSASDLAAGDCDWLIAHSPSGWGAPIVTPRACEFYDGNP